MARCDLTIELDQPREVHHPGDEVAGHVVVQTDGGVRCDGLIVELLWSTHGRGSTSSGDAESLELFQGEWTGSTSMRYPFRFTLPAGPVTYHGHYLNVGWFIRARADIPWKIDPKAETEIVLASGEAEHQAADWERQFTSGYQEDLASLVAEAHQAASDPQVGAHASARFSLADLRAQAFSSPGSSLAACGCLALIVGVPLIFIGTFSMAAWDAVNKARAGEWGDAVPGLIMGGILVALIVFFVGALIRERMIKGRFGTIRFELDPDNISPGEAAGVRISFTPQKDSELEKGTVRVQAYEEVVSGTGTNKSTLRHTVYEDEVEFCGARRLMGRQPVVLEGDITVPEDAAPSFDAPRNQLIWKVEVQLHVARFPDWGTSRRFVVRPATARL